MGGNPNQRGQQGWPRDAGFPTHISDYPIRGIFMPEREVHAQMAKI